MSTRNPILSAQKMIVGHDDGDVDGFIDKLGKSVGDAEGILLGEGLGIAEGDELGELDGRDEGDELGDPDGRDDG